MERSWTWLHLFAALAINPAMAQKMRFQHVTTDEGLSDNAITCLFEDQAGYLWIGTEHGLNRYDGQRVERLDSASEHITAIAQDKAGTIWFSTIGSGLGRFDPGSGSLAHLRHDPQDPRSLPTDVLNHVHVVDDGLFILSTREEGAVWFDLEKGRIRARGFRDVQLSGRGDTLRRAHETWCHAALRVDEHHVWLPVINERDAHFVDERTGELSRIVPDCAPDSKVILTNGAVIGDQLFAGGWAPGVHRFPLSSGQSSLCIPLEDEVTAIVPWEPGGFMAGTKLHGVLHMNVDGSVEQRHRHRRGDASSLISDRIRCMLRDRSGNLWVGTADGLSVHAPQVWRFLSVQLVADSAGGDLVFHRLQQDPDGTIRACTSAGFFLVDPGTGSVRRVTLRDQRQPLEATGLFEVARGMHYLGTETGMLRYDREQERILSPSPDAWFEQYYTDGMFQVRGIHLDTVAEGPRMIVAALGFGSLLITPSGGHLGRTTPGYPRTGPSALLVRDVERDARGDYWSATATCLMRWQPERSDRKVMFVRWSSGAGAEHPAPGDDFTDVLIRGDTVWASLRDGGLLRVVDGRGESFVPPKHIPHDALGVAIDRRGRAWYTTTNGLVCVDPAKKEWLHVPVNDGRVFKRLSGALLALEDGRIACCGGDHVIIFYPDDFIALPGLPEPRLAAVSNTWGDLRVLENASVEVSYRSSAFDATITALRPVGPGRLRFIYRLEGIDAEPRTTTATEPLRYAGVPPGTHRLLVRVRDEFGREGPERALLSITVVGPFWQRWWFFVLVLGVGALSMYLVSRFRQQQLARLQRVRDRIARDLHDDIGSTLGSISFYSEALKRKLSSANDPMAQQVAEKIGTTSREMIDQMSDIVWSVDPKNDDAGALVKRLRDLSTDLLAAKGIDLRFEADDRLRERRLSAEARRNLFLICKEALYNAIKYADTRRVEITLRDGPDRISITIADEGRGFDPANTDSYNGNGLPNMRARAEAVGAELTIDSAPGKGARVIIHLPHQAVFPRSGD